MRGLARGWQTCEAAFRPSAVTSEGTLATGTKGARTGHARLVRVPILTPTSSSAATSLSQRASDPLDSPAPTAWVSGGATVRPPKRGCHLASQAASFALGSNTLVRLTAASERILFFTHMAQTHLRNRFRPFVPPDLAEAHDVSSHRPRDIYSAKKHTNQHRSFCPSQHLPTRLDWYSRTRACFQKKMNLMAATRVTSFLLVSISHHSAKHNNAFQTAL